jgi:hypothetical protein
VPSPFLAAAAAEVFPSHYLRRRRRAVTHYALGLYICYFSFYFTNSAVDIANAFVSKALAKTTAPFGN